MNLKDRLLEPFTHHMRGKLLLSHITVLFLTLSLAAFLLITLIQSYFLSAVERNLETQAQLLTTAILTDPGSSVLPSSDQAAMNTLQQQQVTNLNVQLETKSGEQLDNSNNITVKNVTEIQGLQEATVEVSSFIDTHIQIIDPAGQVVIDSHPGDLPPESFLKPLVAQALSGTSVSKRTKRHDQDWFFYSTPFRSDQGIIGAILLSLPLQDVSAVMNDLTSRWLISILISLPLSILLALVLSNSLTKPILSLTDAVHQLRHGNYDFPLPDTGKDEIGELNRAFENMRTRLQDTERMRTQFISDVSHELRTPLTGIKGLVESLEDGAADDLILRDQFLTSIDRETDRLIRLVNDLMLLSRADSHALNLSTGIFDLRDIVHSAVEITFFTTNHSPQQPSISAPDVPVLVDVDPDRIEQALINLLDNAKQYSDDEDTIDVTISIVRIPPLSDLLQGAGNEYDEFPLKPGEWAVVSVTDSGPGIQEQDLDRVFDRFYRADPARSRSHGGSGLGLSISQAIIESHDGIIWIESPPRKSLANSHRGTSATFALPLRV